jgi:prepilin-type N-terminal cleavage/methylation domain-containing protein
MKLRRARGFTLVEILATMGVLAIGLSAVVSLVLGSTRATVVAADRNTATIFLSEAAENIERLHLITAEVVQSGYVPYAQPTDVGLFIETVNTPVMDAAATRRWPTVRTSAVLPNDSDYGQVRVGAAKRPLKDFVNIPSPDTMVWPPSDVSPRYNGPATSGTGGTSGFPYRVIYHLERHPDWVAHPNGSPYMGIYVLTLAGYRDLTPDPKVAGSDTANKKYEQISEPMIVYLRARNKS